MYLQVEGSLIARRAICNRIDSGRGIRAPTKPSGLGLCDIYFIDRLTSGRGAFSAPAIFKQGFP
jgi:hypothetical protein